MKDLLKYLIPLQPKIKEAMGEWRLHDWMFNFDGEFYAPITMPSEVEELNALEAEPPFQICGVIRIPLTIDPVNPERGLDALLKTKGVDFLSQHYQTLTGFLLDKNKTEWILKALIHQENLYEKL